MQKKLGEEKGEKPARNKVHKTAAKERGRVNFSSYVRQFLFPPRYTVLRLRGFSFLLPHLASHSGEKTPKVDLFAQVRKEEVAFFYPLSVLMLEDMRDRYHPLPHS